MNLSAIRRYFNYGRMGDFIISLILVLPILAALAIGCFLLFCMAYGGTEIVGGWLVWRGLPRCI